MISNYARIRPSPPAMNNLRTTSLKKIGCVWTPLYKITNVKNTVLINQEALILFSDKVNY